LACDWGLVERHALEEAERHEFDGNTPEELASSNKRCSVVLIPVERIALRDLPSHFDHGYLHGECQDGDESEQPISENAREDVELPKLDESRIELIEKLHEDEDLEDHGVMQQFLRWAAVWQVLWQEPPGVSSFIFEEGLWMLGVEAAAVGCCFLLWILSDVFLAVQFFQKLWPE